ncbi:STAS domain-containing protein [Massilia sp. GCM10020059]|uniref:STAS domain-containing protein n=1 Tax=Massilia agrisoli TaxID=2892444 RepID=A0ABS8IQR1_9BURK|nr:STAS domain-containing protein [Massilia agrisoli]MCC6070725.1 STAS domain-containing protein [Massilia agrisoli]
MGIFSRFKRKNDDSDSLVPPPETRLRVGEPSRLPQETEAERARLREIARATAAKIDAIESAMANDIFNTPEPAWGSGPRRPLTSFQQEQGPGTLPMLELPTTELLGDDVLPDAPVEAQAAPVVEESAILYANGQAVAAEHMLRDSLGDAGQHDRSVWWMLFDLYQAGDRPLDFDNLAIDYASRFETSPPAWNPLLPAAAAAGQPYAGVTPTEVLEGTLDAHVAPKLERLAQLAAPGKLLRLELGRITQLAPEGCDLLARTLTGLHARGSELVVAGAAELAALARQSTIIGERESSPAPWLLLLALLQLLNREKDFEETAMDYCVTFEVSPPSFEAPGKVATATSGPVSGERFMLPPVIEGDTANLFQAIDGYAQESEVVLLDCSRLARVEYGAAVALQARLRALAGSGKKIEMRDVNHLVAALFKLLGYAGVARLFPHKY